MKSHKLTKTTDISAVLILPDIRSEHNVGSLFRTADAAGIAKIYLCGYTPAPTDRFGRPVKGIVKTALGAEKMPWDKKASALTLIRTLKKEGFQIIAIEQDPRSVDYKKIRLGKKVAFILGEEVKGLPKKLLDAADVIAEIPMRGEKESLNVSVAGGIALFRILGR